MPDSVLSTLAVALLIGVLLLLALLIFLVWRLAERPAAGIDAAALQALAAAQRQELVRLQQAQTQAQAEAERATRQELQATLGLFQRALQAQYGDQARTLNDQIDSLRTQQALLQQQLDHGQQQALAQQLQQSREAREAQDGASRLLAQAQAEALQRFGQLLGSQLQALSEGQAQRATELRTELQTQLGQIRGGLASALDGLRQDNTRQLEQMRATVDEKLQATLEARLGESFRQVAERLEQVHRGLGEMQLLARDVGALQRVLSNVKTRGVFGEVQLAALLEQVLTPQQYGVNVETVPGSGARVEFAIRLPGRGGAEAAGAGAAAGAPAADGALWLPIDAKFPREDHERLLDARERGDTPAIEVAARALEQRLRQEARRIRDKYLAAPWTTDFAILFLPTEGLYAEALQRPGLGEALQREHRVLLAGPTTLLALLNSLQMGFRTLALEQRSAEVWEVLGAVKTEFAKFGDVLARTRRKLEEAGNSIGAAEVRTRAMARRLRAVEALPEARVAQLLPPDEAAADALPAPAGPLSAGTDGSGAGA
ncbi:DNA recombination protein RmuC [Pseudaquabacterium rugosum]|uniref:DNA recombination protein RmuC n=1 Tax=Pseudaquabacterium rugosum TaxID=2984194 RepID=A0ABU9B5C4_9BURK